MPNSSDSKITVLGQALRDYRQKLSLTQKALSLSLGWAPSRMKSIEFGSRVSDKELEQLATAFKLEAVPSDWYDLRKASGQAPYPGRYRGHEDRLTPFGKFLRDTRTGLGITQEQLAKALDVTNETLLRLHYGHTRNPQKIAGRILYALGFSAETAAQIMRTFNVNGDWPETKSADERTATIKQWYRANAFADSLTSETNTESPSRLEEIVHRLATSASAPTLYPLPPFGTELRRLRREQGLSADAFSKKIKFSAARLGQLEQGYLAVDGKLLKTLAKGLGLPSVPKNWPELVTASHQNPGYECPFGQFLKMTLRARHMGLSAFGLRISMSNPTLQRLVRGTTNLTPERLKLIFKALEIPPSIETELRNVVDIRGQFVNPQTKVLLPNAEVKLLLQLWNATVRAST